MALAAHLAPERSGTAAHHGVVDQGVEPGLPLADPCGQGPDPVQIGQIREVGAHGGPGPGRTHLGGHLVQTSSVAAVQSSVAPRRARSSARWRPIPWVAPVTSTVLPQADSRPGRVSGA